MWPDMFYSHKRPMWGKLPAGISQLPDEIEPTFQWLPPPPFSTTAIPMALTGILPDLTGNGKSKKAACKLVVSIMWLAPCRRDSRTISTANPVFQMSGNPLKEELWKSEPNRKSKLQYGCLQTEIPISQLPGEIEMKFQRLNLHFRGPAIEWD